MQNIPITMIRPHMNNIPQYKLPNGYHIRPFQINDISNWTNIETAVNEFPNQEAALARFNKEFTNEIDLFTQSCLILENKQNEAIGTTTAWYGKPQGKNKTYGRIHWVAIIPDEQGKGLAKPLLSAAMNILAKHHEKAYLTSQTTSYQAINMYLNYGFQPHITKPTCHKAWTLLEEKLNRTIL